jgi:hypothetical protein
MGELDRQRPPWPVHLLVSGPFGFRISPTSDVDGEVAV